MYVKFVLYVSEWQRLKFHIFDFFEEVDFGLESSANLGFNFEINTLFPLSVYVWLVFNPIFLNWNLISFQLNLFKTFFSFVTQFGRCRISVTVFLIKKFPLLSTRWSICVFICLWIRTDVWCSMHSKYVVRSAAAYTILV